MLQSLKPVDKQFLSRSNAVLQNMLYSLNQWSIYCAEIYGSKMKSESRSVPITVKLRNTLDEFFASLSGNTAIKGVWKQYCPREQYFHQRIQSEVERWDNSTAILRFSCARKIRREVSQGYLNWVAAISGGEECVQIKLYVESRGFNGMPLCTPLSNSPSQWKTEVTRWRAGTPKIQSVGVFYFILF